ncbi:hypothetical protein HIM_12322 [Hirsutella minnesotensis 3608]|uniref:Uncharacterized protein n=1 Tax=Hirsutella minnesotensis 3608 TaxID=1043627 RepID=A0A0F7ZW36_9HYPO|nr:hypothetical protein HIM_12322 [Hirsutella minnesotensis 3608]
MSVNNTSYIKAFFDSGCLPYAAFSEEFVRKHHIPRIPVEKRLLKLAKKDEIQHAITDMAFITMDIDGRAERLYGYVIPGLEFDLILGKGWAERNDVVYKAGKRFLQIGRGNSRVKVRESGWMDKQHVIDRTKDLRDARLVSASVFMATTKRMRRLKKDAHLFSVTTADINKALAKLSEKKAKPTLEQLQQDGRIPQEIKDVAGDFLDDDDVDITPPHRDIWDHAINLERDDDGRDKRPPFGPLYEMSRDELLVLRKTLTDHLDKGWIRASSSPASAPVLFARKPGGGLRFCVDYRGLNAITKNDRYPLPLIRETLRNLATARWFTKLDVRAAFHRLRVRHGDEWKTAFRTRYGQFEWLVTPFGLTGAPATFQRYINSHLHDLLDEFCSAYMDDVIIYSDGDYLDHMTKVRTVMERLRNAGLKLDLEKCAFAVKEVKYLGFIIKAGEGVTVDPEKIVAIRDWEAPTTVTGVRSFLGFANFYREFIENFAAVSEPLNNLTKKTSEWDWDASAQNAFNKLKELLITSPVLAMFHSDRETVLECDASGWAVGAVLAQRDEKGRLRPVGYFSRKFSVAEVNYDIHDKELLAIVAAMEHFSGELRSVDKFIVISDHKNLQYFMTNRRLSERQVRLAETLSRYTFKIVFRAGKDNTQPDFLSRRAQDLPANGDDERLKNREFQLLKDHWLPPRTVKHHQGDYIRDQLVSAVQTRRSKTTPIDDSQAPPRGAKLFFDSALQLLWDRGMIEDEEYRNIHASVVQGNATFPSEYNLSVQIPDCEIDDRGALLRRGALWVPNWEPLRTALIQQTHDSHITGHPGRDVTLSILQRSYFWPQQYLMVRQFVRNCNVCSRSKSWRHSPQGLLRPLPIPDRFHSELSVDFMVDLPANGKDPRFLMVICDRLLGSCTLEAMDSMEAEACAERFVQCHYRFHGFPKTMTSDRGSNWVSKFWQRLCELVRTEQRLSTAYHPQTDGATERMNQEVLVYLRIFVAYAQTDWARLLPMAMLAINNRDSSVTGYSPFFLTHGYHAEPIQQTQILSRSKTDPKARADQFIARLREGQELAQAAKATAQQIMEHQANKGRRPSLKFVVGERVWLNLKNVTTPSSKRNFRGHKPSTRLPKSSPPTSTSSMSLPTYTLASLPTSFAKTPTTLFHRKYKTTHNHHRY